MVRNPLYYQRTNNAAIRYEHSGQDSIVKGITIAALPPSTQIRPYKVKPSSWEMPAEARLTIPITNLDIDDSIVIHEKIELVRPDSSTQILLDVYDKTLTPLQTSLDTFDLHDLERGSHEIKVTTEVTGGQLYDYVTVNLPPELWSSVLGPRITERAFWVTTLADINKDGIVNILDIVTIAARFGSKMHEQLFKTEADINLDYKINILDIVGVAVDFGWHY
jgi:hypothetical protein